MIKATVKVHQLNFIKKLKDTTKNYGPNIMIKKEDRITKKAIFYAICILKIIH